jgi:hypothetical protein
LADLRALLLQKVQGLARLVLMLVLEQQFVLGLR